MNRNKLTVYMECNMSSRDRYAYGISGTVLAFLTVGILTGFVDVSKLFAAVPGVLSLGLLFAAQTGKCRLYNLAGINTAN